jgi:uncharacterized protein YigE (DUF2233 family)
MKSSNSQIDWTGEPPNNKPTSRIYFHGFAQFNRSRTGLTQFVFLDGSVNDEVNPDTFRWMGMIADGEVIQYE